MTAHDPSADQTVQALLEARERFVRFLIPRTRSREAAEDLVQTSLLKALQTGAQPRSRESAVAWFYQMLRNALVDQARSRAAEARATERHRLEAPEAEEPEELERVACACIGALLPTLGDGDAGLIRAVDLEARAPKELAHELGITPNALGVRLHRARKALRAKVEQTCRTCAVHGCLDCRCGKGPGHPAHP